MQMLNVKTASMTLIKEKKGKRRTRPQDNRGILVPKRKQIDPNVDFY